MLFAAAAACFCVILVVVLCTILLAAFVAAACALNIAACLRLPFVFVVVVFANNSFSFWH